MFEDLDFGKVDLQREKLKGYPEIIYGEYKSTDHILAISQKIYEHSQKLLITRLSQVKWQQLEAHLPSGHYDSASQLYYAGAHACYEIGKIVIVSAGTSDYAVAQEARLTAEWLGCQVQLIQDVGVAGLGRLLSYLEELRSASLVLVIAGMEGALPSVVSGLVAVPVIAVPTSVGYGANLQGITTLLAMLTSCSSGISVVNIDNGFGAAYQAALMIRLLNNEEE